MLQTDALPTELQRRAPPDGFEPSTLRLTGERSTIELQENVYQQRSYQDHHYRPDNLEGEPEDVVVDVDWFIYLGHGSDLR